MMPAKDSSFQEMLGRFFVCSGRWERDGGPCTPGAHWSRLAPEDNGFASVVRKAPGPRSASFRMPVLKKRKLRGGSFGSVLPSAESAAILMLASCCLTLLHGDRHCVASSNCIQHGYACSIALNWYRAGPVCLSASFAKPRP